MGLFLCVRTSTCTYSLRIRKVHSTQVQICGKVGIAVYSIYFYFLNNVVNSCSIVVVDGLTTVLLLLRGQKVVLATTSGRIKNFKTFVYFLA